MGVSVTAVMAVLMSAIQRPFLNEILLLFPAQKGTGRLKEKLSPLKNHKQDWRLYPLNSFGIVPKEKVTD